MKYKLHQFGNYKIEVYDDIFTLSERIQFYNFISISNFKVDLDDTNGLSYHQFKNLHSSYCTEDLNNLGFFNILGKCPQIVDKLSILNPTKCGMNLSIPFNTQFNNTHPNHLILLYYVNVRWKEEWAGEILFYNDDLNEILFSSPYIPGRILIFDGEIPYKIRTQSFSASHFTFTTLFEKNNGN
jgi:Rps23 Pro-64 3,4-dihydroxylase Tpa1-like proline 4-hydroxylase